MFILDFVIFGVFLILSWRQEGSRMTSLMNLILETWHDMVKEPTFLLEWSSKAFHFSEPHFLHVSVSFEA